MKDVYEVLRQKERDIVRLRMEVEALLFVIPLLVDDRDSDQDATAEVPGSPSYSDRTGTNGLS
jgi:hypothetical protein